MADEKNENLGPQVSIKNFMDEIEKSMPCAPSRDSDRQVLGLGDITQSV